LNSNEGNVSGSNQWIADLFILTTGAGLALGILTLIEAI
tara:strand:+ start:95 stop:211 length:117 start_codon:yes stop_codon:yes gene_type:complete